MIRIFGAALAAMLLLTGAAAAQAPRAARNQTDLRIVAVDVEGGAATLFVTPEGKSLLIDAGWAPGAGGQKPVPGLTPATSADKIVAAAHALGLKKIDYFIITHYHTDHIGGFQALSDKIEIDNFIDHGANSQPDPPNMDPARAAGSSEGLYRNYLRIIAGKNHIVPKPGDALDIGSLHLQFVSVANKVISAPLPQGGQPNPDCAGVKTTGVVGGLENRYSVAALITFGKTRIAAFGDLLWDDELDLLCPINKIGPIDLYLVTQHGMAASSSPPTKALDPVVSIMGNGAIKGGDEAPMKMLASYGHHDQNLWLLHDTIRYPGLNPDPNYIANLDWVPDLNFNLLATVTPAGQITVSNGRNGFKHTYKARGAE